MHHILAAPLFLLVLAGASGQGPAAQDRTTRPSSPALVARLPFETVLYARVASLGRAAAEVRLQAPWRIWQEEEVQSFWESVRAKMFAGPWAHEFERALESVHQLRLLFEGPVSLVVVKSETGEHAAVVFEGCRAGKAADLLLDEMARGPLAGVLRGKPRIEQIGGLKVRTYPHPTQDIIAAASGATMVFGDDQNLVARLCSAGEAPKDKPCLGDTPEFREAWAAAGTADPTVFVFIHTGAAIDALRADDRTEAAAAGIDNVRGIGMSLWAREGEVLDRVTLQTPGGRGGFLAGIAPGPTKAAASKAAPAATLFMSAIPVDLPALHAAAKAMEATGRGQMGMLDELEQMLLGRLQLKLNEDLLQPLGKELTFLVILPPGGALIPELALLAEVRNQAALEKNVDVLVTKGMEAEVKETMFAGHRIRYVSHGADRGMSLNMTPSYTFAGGYLILGSHPNALKRIINTLGGKAPSLAEDEAFKSALARATADGAPAGLVYFNTKRTFEYLHGIATPILNLVGGQELPFDPGSIPTAESVSKHLSVAVNALRLAKDALEIRSFSDGVSLSTLCIYGFAAAACFEGRSIIQARTGTASRCHSNLAAIGEKIEKHRAARKSYPAKAEDIWGDHLEEWERTRNDWLETCDARDAELTALTETFSGARTYVNAVTYRLELAKTEEDRAKVRAELDEYRKGPFKVKYSSGGKDEERDYTYAELETAFDAAKMKKADKEGESPEGPIKSYAYFPEEISLGARESLPPETMLLYERGPFHRGCRIVLFASGRTDWLPEDEFQKKLAAQTAALRAEATKGK